MRMMKGTIHSYIQEKARVTGKAVVSPIWEGTQEFDFLCMGHLTIARAMGLRIRQATPVLKEVESGQISSKATLDALIERNYFDRRYIAEELDELKRRLQAARSGLVGGGCFGPLTVVSDIMGAENFLKLVIKEPAFISRLSENIAGHLMELATAEEDAGAQFFWIAEPVASLLSPGNFWKFSGQYLKRIYDCIGLPGFLHVCGKTLKHTSFMEKTGAEVLSIDFCTDIGKCIRMVGKNTVIMGNVSPMTLRYGTVEDVKNEIAAIREACLGYTNFVLSTGCVVIEGTPRENMRLMFTEEI